MTFMREIWILYIHYLKLSIRNPIWVIVALFQPLCYLLFYAPILEGFANKAGLPDGEALKIFAPGLLVMLAFLGSMFVGFAMLDDLKSGVLERYRVTPVSRLALLLGRSFRDVTTLVFQSVILLLLAIPLGLTTNLVDTFLILMMMGLIGLLFAPTSYALSLALKTEDSLISVINFLSQPMLLLSGILIPLTFAPKWLQKISAINPLTYIVEACRALFFGKINDPVVFHGLIVLIALISIAIFLGAKAYNKSVA